MTLSVCLSCPNPTAEAGVLVQCCSNPNAVKKSKISQDITWQHNHIIMLITLLNIICICWKAKSELEVLLIFWNYLLQERARILQPRKNTFNCNYILPAFFGSTPSCRKSLINGLLRYAHRSSFLIQIVIDKNSFINESA